MTLIVYALEIALAVFLVGAAVQDVRARTISNGWPLAIIMLFVPAYMLELLPGPLWSHLLHFALALAAGMVLFARGTIGGGDAKLYAAAALWLDIRQAPFLLLWVALSGGLLALIQISGRLMFRRVTMQTGSMKDGKIAYGVAIAAGTLITLVLSR